MLLWTCAKKFGYRGWKCRIVKAAVGTSTQYRGRVGVDGRLSSDALAALPIDGSTTHVTGPDDGDWLQFDLGTASGEDLTPHLESTKQVVDALQERED